MAAISAPWPGAVAVSGGSDSIALMHLLGNWATQAALPLPVVLTVDHGLRKGSGEDARAVRRAAKSIGLKAYTLVWDGPKPTRNIEAMARDARYTLMGAWCRSHRVAALFVGHTQDDQAETFLLRLARGTGLDGLAAMQPVARWPAPGFADLSVVRPLLGVSRDVLRSFLERASLSWADDPMNLEPRFARNRIRAVWPALEKTGLTKVRIADAAGHLARARAALEQQTKTLLATLCRRSDGGVALDTSEMTAVPRELGLRLLASVLMSVADATYRPRFDSLEALFDALVSGKFRKGRTLHGCVVAPAGKTARVFGPGTVFICRETGRPKPNGPNLRI